MEQTSSFPILDDYHVEDCGAEDNENWFDCNDCLNDSESENDQILGETPSNLGQKLLLFFQIFNISHRAMEYLLTILNEEGIHVTKSLYNLNKLKKKRIVKYY